MARHTIRDVARHADVSIATVSRVMRDSKSVRPETRDRVVAAAQELQVHPQPARPPARRASPCGQRHRLPRPVRSLLRRGRAGLRSGRRRAPPFGADPLDPRPRRRRHGRAPDGRALRRRRHPRAHRQRRRRRAVGSLGRPARPGRPAPDRRPRLGQRREPPSAVALGQLLLDNGARRITFVGDPDNSPDVAERWQGIQQAVSQRSNAGLELACRRRVRRGRRRARSPKRSWATHCPTPSPAPTTSSPSVCSGALRTGGIDVPGTVKVTGWDDVMAARYAGLTTVRQPMRELGATAARLLDELIVDGRTEPLTSSCPPPSSPAPAASRPSDGASNRQPR